MPAAAIALSALAVGGLALTLSVRPADATFPGKNGKIVYELNVGGGRHTDLFAVDPTGGPPVNLTRTATAEGTPSFSADGREIVYAGKTGRSTELFAIPARGGDVRQLTTLPDLQLKADPTWSPDASTVVFSASTDATTHPQLWSVSADGSGAHRLTSDTRLEEREPSFSPDGSRILFTAQRNARQPGTGGRADVYTINADGSSVRSLTGRYKRAGGRRIVSTSGASFSPDGKRIILAVDFANGSELFMMNANGANLHRVLHMADSLTDPVFSPDGRQIAFVRHGPRNGIYTATVAGERVRRVAAGGAVDAHQSGAFQGGSPNWQPVPAAGR